MALHPQLLCVQEENTVHKVLQHLFSVLQAHIVGMGCLLLLCVYHPIIAPWVHQHKHSVWLATFVVQLLYRPSVLQARTVLLE